ncbi:unnamed protein product [Brassica oleracea]
MLHLRHHRLHLRKCSCRVSELHDSCPKTSAWPSQRYNRSGSW